MLRAKKIRCSACLQWTSIYHSHELLSVPVCEECNQRYYLGNFSIDEMSGNEIYCRWCGQGEGGLILCDSCPKSFCERCIQNNFGLEEAERLKSSQKLWHCFLCYPEPLKDLIKRKYWDNIEILPAQCLPSTRSENPLGYKEVSTTTRSFSQIKCIDVTRGREKFEIPVINEYDEEEAPLDFVYITKPVVSHGAVLTNHPNSLICCSCESSCRDTSKCECAIASGGSVYSLEGRLLREREETSYVYECNYKCRCDRRICKNRVVSNGPQLKLEVFRCENTYKGWGVRCQTDIPPGTFIADYVGEILPENAVEKRGLEKSDEYLYNMDGWSRGRAHSLNLSLGLNEPLDSIPREHIVDSSMLDEKGLEKYFDAKLIERLSSSGAIRRAQEKKRKLGEEQSKGNTRSWYEEYIRDYKQEWDSAIISFTDRVILESDTIGKAFTIDARYEIVSLCSFTFH